MLVVYSEFSIQLQLNNDTEFLSKFLKTNSQIPQTSQGGNSSPNCSDVLGDSDGEKRGEQESDKSSDVTQSVSENLAAE